MARLGDSVLTPHGIAHLLDTPEKVANYNSGETEKRWRDSCEFKSVDGFLVFTEDDKIVDWAFPYWLFL
jgi:hypothetical protein